MKMFMMSTILGTMIMTLFYLISKSEKKESFKSSVFECGFSSYFYSRFSFSIHYYLVGLIFLFLDLELCLMMPMMMEMESSIKMKYTLTIFLLSLLMALLLEWHQKKLEWKS